MNRDKLRDKLKEILKFIPKAYCDRYGILGEEKAKYTFVSKTLALLNEFTPSLWKTNGNFKPIYNIFGIEIDTPDFKGYFEDEEDYAIRNIFDLLFLKRENEYKYRECVKYLKKNFIKEGDIIGGLIDFQNDKKTGVTGCCVFLLYQPVRRYQFSVFYGCVMMTDRL